MPGLFASFAKLYTLLHRYASVEAMIKKQNSGECSQPQNWRKKLNPTGRLVQETASVVCGLLRQVKSKTYRVYPGTRPEYNRKAVAMRNMVPYGKKECSFFEVDFAKGLELQVAKCREKYFKDWMAPFLDIWPEFKPPQTKQVDSPSLGSQSGKSHDETGSDSDDHPDESKTTMSPTVGMTFDDGGNDEAPIFQEQDAVSSDGALDEEVGRDDSLTEYPQPGSPAAGGSSPEEKSPLFTLSQPRPASPIDKKTAGTYMWDDSQNIIPGGRAARRNKGRRTPDPLFPMVDPAIAFDTPERKRRRH